MLVQASLCRTCSETTLLGFPRDGSFVLIIFQPKDKEVKAKSGHKFISASVSNSMLCDVCGKALAHKPALKCESE